MIRLLALSSISPGKTKLIARGKIGLDIESMISAMESLGVGIERYEKNGQLCYLSYRRRRARIYQLTINGLLW